MIYLSQLLLNPQLRQVRAELGNPYEMHRSLAKAFPHHQGNFSTVRCLFRVDVLPSTGQYALLVQSRIEPCWDRLTVAETYLLRAPAVKEFTPAVEVGQRLRFRLRANPTKRIGADREDDKLACKRVQLFTDEEQMAWLQRKGQECGFALMDARISAVERQISRKGDGARVIHQAVTFDGVLRVIDPAAFRDALEAGIGPGKGFGFGLLSVARG